MKLQRIAFIIGILLCLAALCTSNAASEDTAGKSQVPCQRISPSMTATVSAAQLAAITPPAENAPARAAQYINISMTEAERDELAAIVYLEAGNQSEEAQQAVVEVVFNRVLNTYFPATVHDVLFEGADSSVPQFSPIALIDTVTPGQAQYDAIDGALYGDTILDADVVYFSRNGENDRVWGQIGDHVFCREYLWG